MKGSILLTGNEIKILRALESPKEAQDIASATGINRTGIYKMLHRLERKGFIDQHGTIYQLSIRGREIRQSYKG